MIGDETKVALLTAYNIQLCYYKTMTLKPKHSHCSCSLSSFHLTDTVFLWSLSRMALDRQCNVALYCTKVVIILKYHNTLLQWILWSNHHVFIPMWETDTAVLYYSDNQHLVLLMSALLSWSKIFWIREVTATIAPFAVAVVPDLFRNTACSNKHLDRAAAGKTIS